MDFDPRAWNLLGGLALAAGCGSHTISSDHGDSTDSVDSVDSVDSIDESESQVSETHGETGDECNSDDDCSYGYCYDGMCKYSSPPQDGYVPYNDCYSDSDCQFFQLCDFNYCEDVWYPNTCAITDPHPIVHEIGESVLALAFVDVDADGADELVAATQTQLHVFESGSPVPVTSLRGAASPIIDAMVGGSFDAMPGDDVIVLHDDTLDLHRSAGLGFLTTATSSPSPYALSLGLEAGAFDGEPLSDLLVWGSNTTGVLYGSGEQLGVLGGEVVSASARDLGLSGNGFSLLQDSDLLFVDIGGFIVGSASLHGSAPRRQAGFELDGAPLEASSSVVIANDTSAWTLVEVWERDSSSLSQQFSLPGAVTHMRAGNLDSIDEDGELAIVADDSLWLYIQGECVLPIPHASTPLGMAFGDHDGDGDDELAFRTDTAVSIVDVE